MAFEPPPTQAMQRIRQPPGLGQDLLARLAPDDRLEIAHHGRVGMRAERRAQQVVGVAHIGHPVADGLVDGVFQGAAAAFHRAHLGAQQLMRSTLGCWRAMSTAPM